MTSDEVSAVAVDSDDDYEYDEEEAEEEVELGFVSKIEQPLDAKLLHESANWGEWDGGLVGGKPRWLNPATVPSTEALACTECATPLSFLLQIYCPLDDQPDAFHRSLYVFCCRKPGCAKQGSGKAFRSQLPQNNSFYPPTSGIETFETSEPVPSLCALCGQRSVFTCSACHVAKYCCKEHQKDHWSKGHKADCGACQEQNAVVESNESRDTLRTKGSKWLFPQYEVEIEHEPDAGEAVTEHEAKLLADFERNKRMAAAHAKDGDESDPFTDDSEIDVSQKDLNEALGSTAQQDKNYIRFLTRVELAKDQVLRYARWQENSVLWVHEQETLASDAAPPCARCGAARKFEFQVLPQLLFYLQVDQTSSLQQISEKSCEWGTLAVYTCTESCNLNGEYSEEFLHYQTPYAGA
ncbi:hypothetical protein Poli38472_014135 [Pythium oligandrum]|uniref:MYND-type domain-containing protein n=1 Tax=Pythium oligandrum TaxID=41045 RepID=A0A8K1FMV4_PYTOL|nr:hypothetical protein Poli38472_014135 [Pythium oligandrum]|eukprot:TMW64018.1 hypothetical protein Poli38472_014135 [Pythium oligandrum]